MGTAGGCAPAHRVRPGSCRSPAAAPGRQPGGCGRNRSPRPRRRKIPTACAACLTIARIPSRLRPESVMNDSSPRFDRRRFLVGGTLLGGTLAAGVVIGIQVGRNRFDARGDGATASGATFQPNAFVRVAPDDSVTIVMGKSEMGQGVY